jgi:hypothetical protein
MKRLSSLMQNTDFAINFGAATFPDHALTFEQLLEHAETDLQHRINGPISADVLKEA